jgi:hypothetical protein
MDASSFLRARNIQHNGGLPEHIKCKAVSIIQALENGMHFQKLGGKRMEFDRNLISIPVGFSYRMVARDDDGNIVIHHLVSHEQYNKLIRRR